MIVEVKLVNVDFSISKNPRAWKGPSASVSLYTTSIAGFLVVTDRFLKKFKLWLYLIEKFFEIPETYK